MSSALPPLPPAELRQQTIAAELRRQDPARYPNTEAGGHRAMEDAAVLMDGQGLAARATCSTPPVSDAEVEAVISMLRGSGWMRSDVPANQLEALLRERQAVRVRIAAAEARGMQRAAEAALDEPCTSPQWTEARAAEEALKGRTYRRILALLPHQLEGGADDAG